MSKPTSETPGKLSTSIRKEMRSNPTQFDKHFLRILGKAINENCSMQNVSEAIANQKKRVLTN